MKICAHCFEDIELKSVVSSYEHIDECDICHQTAQVYNTETDSYLVDIIDDFMNMYRKADESIASKYRLNLEEELIQKWNIFSDECANKVKGIISAIYSHLKKGFDESLFDAPVYIPEMTNIEHVDTYSILKNKQWDEFADYIKHVNRYHSDILDEINLDRFIEPLILKFEAGTVFYRSRISDKKGFQAKYMKMPPAEKASAGRIGAAGIPCFYLANDVNTSIQEVRAGAFDYVTVAKYKILKPIKVIDLRCIDHISPFSIQDPVALAINRETLLKIKSEIEKPVRISDQDIEYVPIQFICDYIRKKGYDGIVYRSTMNKHGYNLSAFSDNNFKFVSKSVYYVNNISISPKKISTKG